MLSNSKYQKLLKEIAAIPDVECDCDYCKKMCHGFTCRPTPQEARLLIRNGYASKLTCQRGHTEIKGEIVHLSVLKPACEGSEGQFSGMFKRGKCVMLNEEGHCILHGTAMKPSEGRKVSCQQNNYTATYELVEEAWNSKEGEKVVEHWRNVVYSV